ncbi:MAG: universal stress protein [Solirubrobacterales bacterium]
MRRLLIGLDDTPQGEDALVLGGLMADVLTATPVVVSALPYPRHLVGAMDASGLQQALETDTAERFQRARELLAPLHTETRAVASQAPARALYEAAADEDALMVVVGSDHSGALGRVLPGSAGRSLLHGAPCAVVVAPKGYAEQDEHRLVRIGVAFDGSPESWTALETGIGLTARLHGSILLVAAAMPPQYGYGSLTLIAEGGHENAEQRSKHRTLRMAAERIPAGMQSDTRLLNGDPVHVIAEVTEELDLLLMGSRGYGPLRRTLLGSVAAGVIARAACPVAVLPRAAGTDPLRIRGAPVEAARAGGGSA